MRKFLPTNRTPRPTDTSQIARTERKTGVPPKPAARPAKQPPRLGTAKATAPPKPAAKTATHTIGPACPNAAAKTAPNKIAPAAPSARDTAADATRDQVVADAARLVQWGRRWYELPELIARMADRPPLPEVRRILKENKSAIDAQAEAPTK